MADCARPSSEGLLPPGSHDLEEMIVNALVATGLQKDCPYDGRMSGSELDAADVDSLDHAEFKSYVDRLYVYLQEVESRLFSEGLHVLGQGLGLSLMS